MAGPADDKPNVAPPPRAEAPKGSVRPPVRPGGPKALIGATISDRYKIERLLGEGGMGAVYRAEHTLMRKRMAIKVLHPEMTRLPEVVARFEREAMAAAHIDHPHVVTATDFGKLDDGSFFLALEFVEGRSLREVIAGGRLELGRALHIARQIASALSRAHALKIVHRDLKPENVMLVEREGDPNFVKVLDFGIAKVQIGELTAGDAEQAGPGQPVLTQAGMVYGTPEYMAPEQALGQPVDARADLYALGCIMYEMLCGVRPFDADSKVALLGMQVTAPVPPMASKAPDANVPPDVEAIVKHLLAKEAAERLGDARELIDGITAAMGQLVAQGLVDPAFAPPSRPTIGTNPAIISGFGPAPDLGSPPRSSPALGTAGGKTWMLAAGGGLLGIVVLILTLVAVLGGHEASDPSSSDSNASPTPVATTSLDRKIEEAVAKIDKGDFASGIEALEGLGDEAKGREDVHRALFKAYSQTNQPEEAMREVGLVIEANPAIDLLSADGIMLRQEIRNTALLEGQPTASKNAVDEAFLLLNGRIGTIGFDDLYDIAYGNSGVNYPKAQARAKTAIARGDRTKMSPALAVTADLHAAFSSCGKLKALLDRAVDEGDARTLALLVQLKAPRYRGHWKKTDMLGCIHEGSLTKAITELDARLKKKKK